MISQGKYCSLAAIAGLAMIGAIASPTFAQTTPHAETIQLAQLFYPPATDQKMIRVIGKGTVRQAADVAEIQVLVDIQETYEDSDSYGDSDPYEDSEGDFSVPLDPSRARETQRGFDDTRIALNASGDLTEDDFAPLIKAIVKSGISRSDISVKITKARPSISPFPLPSLGNSNQSFVLVKVPNPTPNKIESVVVAAENHLQNSSSLSLDDVKVNYKINKCEQLKLKAFEAAVGDAQKRAEAIAGAMGAKLSASASVAEPFFNMFVPGCASGKGFSLPGKKNSYEPGNPIEVVIDRIIFFTYTIEE